MSFHAYRIPQVGEGERVSPKTEKSAVNYISVSIVVSIWMYECRCSKGVLDTVGATSIFGAVSNPAPQVFHEAQACECLGEALFFARKTRVQFSYTGAHHNCA